MNFKLGEKEVVREIIEKVRVKANNRDFWLKLIITNERLILFKDVNKDILYNQFLSGRGVEIPKQEEIVFNCQLTKIKEVKYQEGVNIITFKDNNNKLEIYASNLKKEILKENKNE